MGNLGLYLLITTVAAKVGGVIPFLAIILILGAILSPIIIALLPILIPCLAGYILYKRFVD